MRRILSALLAGVAVAGLGACGLVDGGRDGGGGAGGGAGGDGGRFVELLGRIPDEPSYRAYVLMADVERARASVGATQPGDDDAALEQLFELSLATDGSPSLLTAGLGSNDVRDLDEWRQAFGFTVAEVAAGFDAGEPPEDLHGVVVADIAAVGEAVRDDPDWRDQLREVDHDGSRYFAWGEEGVPDFERAGGPRPLGVGGRLLVDEDASLVVRANFDAPIRAAIDAADGASLADDGEVRALVTALDAAGVSSLYLTAAQSIPQPYLGAGPDVERSGVPRAELLGGGHGIVDGEPVMLWAGLFRTESNAAAAAEVVGLALAEGVSFVTGEPLRSSVEPVSITVEERLVVATLRPVGDASVAWLWRAFQQRDVLYSLGP
ncbi:MAG: hypothetical protein AB7O92_05125 [Acidimicrobiia bacterium]